MLKFIHAVGKWIMPLVNGLDFVKPVVDLAARLWVANVFFFAGLDKIQHWAATVVSFQHEYAVPFLSPKLAACLGTGAEIVLPILLLLGFGGRISILIFFIYNT